MMKFTSFAPPFCGRDSEGGEQAAASPLRKSLNYRMLLLTGGTYRNSMLISKAVFYFAHYITIEIRFTPYIKINIITPASLDN